ncbi:MAG: DMT family transporter, partial [Micrococcales bacterium]|nr:DMT family transporter [Micrococcales bacterium]
MSTANVSRRTMVVPAVLVAALSGVLVAAQGRFNGDLSAAGAGALVASWLSYVGTTATTVVVLLAQGRAARTVRILAHDARWWWYAVGLCGVPIVIMFALGIPVVGVAIASVCSVAGQTVAGLTLDARGIGVPAPLRLTGRRLTAAVLAVAGLAVAIGSGPTTNPGKVVGLGALMFVAGMVLSGQQAGNGRVNLVTNDAVLPVLTSSSAGSAALTLLVGGLWLAGHLGTVSWPGHWYLYLGGPLGSGITVCAAWAIRHPGTFALTLGVVVGQMIAAIVIDLTTGVGARWPTGV